MKQLDRVLTDLGQGTIVEVEGDLGFLADRYLVQLDIVPNNFKELHNKYNGLYFHKDEFIK